MSTEGSYLNSKVSLISKASIRYEGTLYSINPQEATITLSNGRFHLFSLRFFFVGLISPDRVL